MKEMLWHKHKWPKQVRKSLDYPDEPLFSILDKAAKKAGDQPYTIYGPPKTYAEVQENANRIANFLASKGVKKGDRVALYLPNTPHYPPIFFGVIKAGAVVVTFNPRYKVDELRHQLVDSGVKVIFVFDHPVLVPRVYETIKGTDVKHVITCSIKRYLSKGKAILGGLLGKIPKSPYYEEEITTSFDDIIANYEPKPPEVKIKPKEDLALVLYTGGTTGVPKPAVITHYNCVTNAKQNVMWMPDADHPMACIGILPMFHAFGMTIVQNVVIEGGDYNILFAKRQLELKEVIDTILEVGPEKGVILPGVENLFISLTRYLKENPEPRLKNMFRLCVSGAGPLHKPVKDAFEAVSGGKLVEAYGLTECTTAVSAGPFDGTDTPGTIGLPYPGVDWAIFDAEDFSKGPLEGYGIEYTGEICVYGPQVMKGYLNNPEATAGTLRKWDDRIWCLTGDIGYMDEKGQIVIRDRKKQMIKYKGYSVFPKEVEELLGTHPGILEVAVAGLPDPETGEMVKAWVQLKDDSKGKVNSEQLIKWCKDNITHYKCPKLIEIIEEIPKTMVGKVQRRVLQEADPIWKEKYGRN